LKGFGDCNKRIRITATFDMAEKPARATTNSRVNFSLLFLMAALVSVVSETTDSLQEIHVDAVHNGDGISSSRHDPSWPRQEPARRRRKPTGADRQKIIDTLNRLRRSLGAPDMYYAVSYIAFLFTFDFSRFFVLLSLYGKLSDVRELIVREMSS